MKSITLLILMPLFLLADPGPTVAQDLKPIPLMQFQSDTGRPLVHVLKERKSSRAFSPRNLPKRVLSNILWAANGINRPASGGRTAPSAMNQQEIDIYVATAEGLYLFDAKGRQLRPVLKQDIRGLTGVQDYVRDAPVNLIYVADFTRMLLTPAQDREFYAAADTGFISQNIYLYCASEGLATVVRGGIDRAALAEAMKLRPDQKIILAQSVGYPKK
ncbi:MAG: nitroreductase [Syntrophus sp. (in: bacteria)]|nr:nitroreductase [Syntrophus sp. (in: bacteria)]